MPPSYSYSPEPRPSIVNWPKAILAGFGISILILVFIFFVWGPLSAISGKTNYFLNQSQNNNKGTGSGIANPNSYNCSSNVVYTCQNFTTRAEAQYAFDFCFPTAGDVYHLDKDGDKKVCKMLP